MTATHRYCQTSAAIAAGAGRLILHTECLRSSFKYTGSDTITCSRPHAHTHTGKAHILPSITILPRPLSVAATVPHNNPQTPPVQGFIRGHGPERTQTVTTMTRHCQVTTTTDHRQPDSNIHACGSPCRAPDGPHPASVATAAAQVAADCEWHLTAASCSSPTTKCRLLPPCLLHIPPRVIVSEKQRAGMLGL